MFKTKARLFGTLNKTGTPSTINDSLLSYERTTHKLPITQLVKISAQKAVYMANIILLNSHSSKISNILTRRSSIKALCINPSLLCLLL